MNQTKEFLFKLIQVALTQKMPKTFPCNVEWDELCEIARAQGVSAIAMDGLQMLIDKDSRSTFGLQIKTKLQWFAFAMYIEQIHSKQLESSKELADIWHAKGIRTLVLKGFAFAQYYPKPLQRLASDMDCYLCGNYELGNQVVEHLGINVEREDYRHSTFQFKNVFVENHKICTTVRGKKQRKVFEKYLHCLLENEPTKQINGSNLEAPCDLFNALYFLQHSHRHFLREGITLRYICDWAMILKKTNCIDNEFWIICEKNDLKPFAETMSRLAYFVCGVKASWIDKDTELQEQDWKLLNDCYHIADNAIKYDNNLKAHFQLVKNMLNMRWKYKFFSQRTMGKELLCSVWSNLFEKNPQI